MSQRRHQPFRIAFLVILGLLFQQVALATYACPLTTLPADPISVVEDCTTMGMQQAQDNPALCGKHCAPDLSLLGDNAAPGVPALALPQLAFDLVLAQPVSRLAPAAEEPINRSDPPPRLRYCSLLI